LSACGGSGSSNGGGYRVETDLIPVSNGEQWLYINRSGEVAIKPQFELASFFCNGLARVMANGLYGFINPKGEYVIRPQYEDATHFTDGTAWVVSPGSKAVTLIDTKGDVLLTKDDVTEVWAFSDGLARFTGGDGYGYMNKKGKVVIAPQFSDAGPFINGRAMVTNKEWKVGMIDKSGNPVSGYQFDDHHGLTDAGYGIVQSDGKWGIIDRDGKYVCTPQFKEIFPDGDLFRFEEGIDYGWCDYSGKIIIPSKFENPSMYGGSSYENYKCFFNDCELAPVFIRNRAKGWSDWGYIDRSGKTTVEPQFEVALPFMGNIAPVVDGSRKLGFMDKSGMCVVKPEYEYEPYGNYFDTYCAYYMEDQYLHSSVQQRHGTGIDAIEEELIAITRADEPPPPPDENFVRNLPWDNHNLEAIPTFDGKEGTEGFEAWVQANLNYSGEALKNGFSRRATVRFIIDSHGNLTDVALVQGANIPELDNEALRVVRSSPQWTPARERGTAIKGQYHFFVVFSPK
jgi:TonB family protein